MIEIPSIRGVFEYFRNEPLVVETIILSMRKAGVYLETEKMEYRRGQCVLSWIKWAINNVSKYIT